MVVTRSQAKRGETFNLSKGSQSMRRIAHEALERNRLASEKRLQSLKRIAREALEKDRLASEKLAKAENELWKKWLTDKIVTDYAVRHCYSSGFVKKLKNDDPEEFEHYTGYDVIYRTIKNWRTLPDDVKAPFITQALKDLVIRAELWEKNYGNVEAKDGIKMKLDEGGPINLFIDKYTMDYFESHPNCNQPKYLLNKIKEKFKSLTDAEKTELFDEYKKECADLEKLYAKILNDKDYKVFRKFSSN